MKQVYTNENRLLAMNSKNTLEIAGIAVDMKNWHTSAGGVPGHQVWIELWVDDSNYEKSIALLKTSEVDESKNWFCSKCNEENTESFKICWYCQNESS